MKKIKKLWNQYWEPSSKLARRIGDGMLLIIIALSFITVIDSKIIDISINTLAIILIIGIIIKFITNFTIKRK